MVGRCCAVCSPQLRFRPSQKSKIEKAQPGLDVMCKPSFSKSMQSAQTANSRGSSWASERTGGRCFGGPTRSQRPNWRSQQVQDEANCEWVRVSVFRIQCWCGEGGSIVVVWVSRWWKIAIMVLIVRGTETCISWWCKVSKDWCFINDSFVYV